MTMSRSSGSREKFFQRILPVLGGAADGVEEAEMLIHLRLAVLLDHGRFEAALHFLGFATQHGGLVGHADGVQDGVGVKTGGIGALELLEELLLVAAIQDVVADVVGFIQVENDEIMTVAVGAGLRSGGLGFLVLGFAVDDAGDGFLGILAHAFPDTHHVAAGRVHQLAALFLELAAGGHFGAERRDDDGIAGVQLREFARRWAWAR